MDFADFTIILGIITIIVYGLTDRLKTIWPEITPLETGLISIAFAIGLPYILAYSTFGDKIPVGDTHLSELNWLALLVIGLLGVGGSTLAHRTIDKDGAIANIGQNRNDPGPSQINVVPLDTEVPDDFEAESTG